MHVYSAERDVQLTLNFCYMAKTYTQLYVHIVFASKYKTALIHPGWKQELHQYITGIIQSNHHKMLQINSMPDHVHLFIGMLPNQSVSSLIQNVKTESSRWIKEKGFCSGSFAWQEGYGAFSYAKSQVNHVIRYIQNQESHHKKKTFLEEFKKLLDAYEINWNKQYIFHALQ